jgi:hypothetical protein
MKSHSGPQRKDGSSIGRSGSKSRSASPKGKIAEKKADMNPLRLALIARTAEANFVNDRVDKAKKYHDSVLALRESYVQNQ